MLVSFSYAPKTKASSEDETNVAAQSNYSNFVIAENIYADKKLEIKVVESEHDKQVKEVLDEYKHDYPDLLKIANCESGYRNIRNSRSSASGIFQIVKGTWNSYSGYLEAIDAPEEIQWQKAVEIYSQRGVSPWNASLYCQTENSSVSSNLTSNILLKEPNKYAYNCETYLESIGVEIPQGYGYAKNLPVKTKTPFVGAVMVSYESDLGHVSLVREIEGNILTVEDGNFYSGYRTIRTIYLNSWVIKGFI